MAKGKKVPEDLHYLTVVDMTKAGGPASFVKTTPHWGAAGLGQALIACAAEILGEDVERTVPRVGAEDDYEYGTRLAMTVEARKGGTFLTWGCFDDEA